MPQTAPRHYTPRHYTLRHLDFTLTPQGDTVRLSAHSAEVLRGLLGGDLTASGYKPLGQADLPPALAAALEQAFAAMRTPLDSDDGPSREQRRQRRAEQAERLAAFFRANRDNPLVADGVVIDPRSESGRRLVAMIRAGQAEPRLLHDWVRLRIEWRQILDG